MPPFTLPRTLWNIAYSVGLGFFTNRLSTSAAAMAFYTMFAIGPIMIFSITVAEPIVGRLMAQEAVFEVLGTVLQPDQLQGIKRYASQELFRGGGLGGRHRRARAGLYGQPRLRRTGRQHQRHLEHARDPCAASGEPFQPVLATLQSRLLALAMMVILGLLLIAVILASVLTLCLCRRAREVSGAGRVDRTGHIGVHPLLACCRPSSP